MNRIIDIVILDEPGLHVVATPPMSSKDAMEIAASLLHSLVIAGSSFETTLADVRTELGNMIQNAREVSTAVGGIINAECPSCGQIGPHEILSRTNGIQRVRCKECGHEWNMKPDGKEV